MTANDVLTANDVNTLATSSNEIGPDRYERRVENYLKGCTRYIKGVLSEGHGHGGPGVCLGDG